MKINQEAKDFWQQQLKGFTAPTALTVDNTLSKDETRATSYQAQTETLSENLTASLRALAEDNKLTVHTLIQGAWAILLHRYSAEERVLFGVVEVIPPEKLGQKRNNPPARINFLPLSSRLSAEKPLLPWLKELQAGLIALQAYADTPLAKIHQWSDFPPGVPLFESAVILEPGSINIPALNELFLAESPPSIPPKGGEVRASSPLWGELEGGNQVIPGIADDGARNRLSLLLAAGGKKALALQLVYTPHRFAGATIGRMLGHLKTLLEGMAANPASPLAQLPLLTPAERKQLFSEWNPPPVPDTSSQTITQRFEAQVEQMPDAIAVVFEEQFLTYGELNNRANQLAHYLQKQGVEPERLAGLCTGRAPEMVIGLLGILKAGGGYLPLDHQLPLDRQAYMLSDAAISILLTQAHLAGNLPTNNTRLVCLDADWDAIALESTDPPPNQATLNTPAYVIYTSGSSGRPKGVVIEQRQILNYVGAIIARLEIEGGASLAMLQPLAVDSSQTVILPAFHTGGTLHLISEQRATNPEALAGYFERHPIDLLKIAPSHLAALQTIRNPERVLPRRWLIVGGEASPRAWLEQVQAMAPNCAIFNHYGPTETTVGVLTYRLGDKKNNHRPGIIPIGRPLSHAQAYILDGRRRPVPIGVPGELYIGGPCLARGYLGDFRFPIYDLRLEADDEKFSLKEANLKSKVTTKPAPSFQCSGVGTSSRALCVPGAGRRRASRYASPRRSVGTREEEVNPKSKIQNLKLYRTGDLARYLPDGNIEFLGRTDSQVKIRGFRIELPEIETVLSQIPAIRNAAVVAQGDDGPGSTRLIAYVVPRRGTTLTPAELRRYLATRLPNYMIPATFITLEAMPRTPHGKLNRSALPQPTSSRPALASTYVAPQTDLEHLLVALWQETLGVEPIGIDDNFFELGGDSLKGAIFINNLQNRLGEYLYIVALFEAPTIAGFSRYLGRHYASALANLATTAGAPVSSSSTRLDASQVAEMRRRLKLSTLFQYRSPAVQPPLNPPQRGGSRTISPPLGGIKRGQNTPLTEVPKNRPAIFILSPPRSGSTLLRIMLAGHPHLFAPPELALLSFKTLGDRRKILAGRFQIRLEGAMRAIMELNACDAETARQVMASYETQNLPVQAFYRLLQEQIGGKTLVDKTTYYALDLATLQQTEALFENALYLHLCRHPRGMIHSFERVRQEQIFFREMPPFSRRTIAELTWLISQQNILDFLKGIPARRQYRLKFEDIVTQPQQVMTALAAFLDLEADPYMWKPYKSQETRMTDGLYALPHSRMVGDVKFHQHQTINPQIADAWREANTPDFLGDITWQVAERLGYSRQETAKPAPNGIRSLHPKKAGQPKTFPLSFAQQRLWFLQQLEPNSATYNMLRLIRLHGELKREALQEALQAMVARHEALRTTFITLNEQPLQAIAPGLTIPLPQIDLAALSPAQQNAEIRRLSLNAARRPFDLAVGPLLRVQLLGLSKREHILLLTINHIISDGWSMRIFFRELGAFYEARLRGRDANLPDLPLQYADFTQWQRDWLQGRVLERQLRYWRDHLGHPSTVIRLPLDRPRPRVQTDRGAVETRRLSQDLSEALRTLSRREETTLYMTLLAAFKTLLHRYSGQQEIRVGTVVANRNRPETEGLVGFFANTLALQTDLSGNPTFQTLLQRMRRVALGAYAHQDLPFEKLVEELQPQRDLSRNPLVQVFFGLNNLPKVQLPGLTGLTMEIAPVPETRSKFDLTLNAETEGDLIRLELIYNPDLFEQATMHRMLGHLENLLLGIVADPEQRLSDLPLLGESERQQLLVTWNQTQVQYQSKGLIHHHVEGWAEQTPTAPALFLENQSLSYRQLNRRANQVAHHLQKLGVGPEVAVALYVERSLEMIVGLLGILKAGGVYLPLDPALPAERLALILKDARVALVLTQQKLRRAKIAAHSPPLIPPTGGETKQSSPLWGELEGGLWGIANTVCLDSDWEQIAGEPEENPNSEVTPENLAYIIYTSGSSGQPKGVGVAHRAAVDHFLTMQRLFKLEPNDRALQFAALSFDVSLEQIFSPLFSGAGLVLRGKTIWEPEAFFHRIRTFGVTVADLAPIYLHQLAQALLAKPAPAQNSPLRLISVGGETISPETVRLWQQTPLADVRLLNVYGPTEAVIAATAYEVPPHFSTAGGHRRVPIGRPLPNRTVYILDSHGNPLPTGAAGELHIGGPILARGYLNRPELTEEYFIEDTGFLSRGAGEPGSGGTEGTENDAQNRKSKIVNRKLYKTGDLARYLPDGNIEFLGRMDQQIKLRGLRIELGEIEAVLHQHPTVGEAVVLVQQAEQTPQEQFLVAYISLRDNQKLDQNQLRIFLREKLPAYMIPALFVSLETIPRAPGNKIDRRALPKTNLARRQGTTSFLAPRAPVEVILAKIWAELLGVSRVGLDDNFFALGGHSLIATQVISRIKSVFRISLPLRTIFETPTLAGQAGQLIQYEGKPGQVEAMARLRQKIDRMSPQEIQATLQDKKRMTDEERKPDA